MLKQAKNETEVAANMGSPIAVLKVVDMDAERFAQHNTVAVHYQLQTASWKKSFRKSIENFFMLKGDKAAAKPFLEVL